MRARPMIPAINPIRIPFQPKDSDWWGVGAGKKKTMKAANSRSNIPTIIPINPNIITTCPARNKYMLTRP